VLALGAGVLPPVDAEGELAVIPGLPQAVSVMATIRMRAWGSLVTVTCHRWWNAGWLIFVTCPGRDRRYGL